MALKEYEKTILDEIIKWENAEEAVLYLIQSYAELSVSNAEVLLGAIPQIADAAIKRMAEYAARHSQASFWLIAQREMKPDESGEFFSTMVPVCMARFPKGNANRCCKAEKEYFDLFTSMFQDKKHFSWKKDKKWADLNGYTDYLLLVESQLNGGK